MMQPSVNQYRFGRRLASRNKPAPKIRKINLKKLKCGAVAIFTVQRYKNSFKLSPLLPIIFSIHLSRFLNGGFDTGQRNYITID